MKHSIGIDIVDVEDFEKKIKRTKNLITRLFTDYEIEYCKKRGVEHLASRFAAKEAFVKATNMQNLSWQDVEVRNDKSGKPHLRISPKILKQLKIKSIDVSISNIRSLAIAVVIIDYN